MMFLYLLLLFGVGFGFVMNVDGVVFDYQDFYSKYTRLEWENASEKQKKSILNDYVKRESCAIDAKNKGFVWDPFVVDRFRVKKNQLLVNFTYEQQVARPLIKEEIFLLGLKNLRKEVFLKHILISFNTTSLSSPPSRTKDEAYNLSVSIVDSLQKDLGGFGFLVEKHSDDPSVQRNGGVLGWIQWGRAPMPFQKSVWGLLPGEVSNPILTDYGYHVVVVEQNRPSEFSFYDESSYNQVVLASSIPFIKEDLRAASLAYDKKEMERVGLVFYRPEIEVFLDEYLKYKNNLELLGKNFIDFTSLLTSLDRRFLICSFLGEDYGLLWFLSEIKKLPPSKIPTFTGVDGLIDFFKTFILRDLALRKAKEVGLDRELFFLRRLGVEKNKILYDAYLKFLVNSVEVDSSSVKQYFLMNRDKKYVDPEKVLVRQLRLKSKVLADSLFSVVEKDPELFEGLVGLFSINRREVLGLMEPFERGKYNEMGDVAFELSVGQIAGPIENLDKSFSIIRLEGKIDKQYLDVSRVYKRIESLLIKEAQDNIKKTTFDGYLNSRGLMFGNEFKSFFN